MATGHKIIGILPQIEFPNPNILPEKLEKDVYVLPPYVEFSKISPQFRQRLCGTAQMIKDPPKKNDILDQIEKSHIVIGINLPIEINSDVNLKLFCPLVAYVILNRLSDLIRLFVDFPNIEEAYWFLCKTGIKEKPEENISLISSRCFNFLEDRIYGKMTPDNEINTAIGFWAVETFWNKLNSFSQIHTLMEFLGKESTWKKLLEAGNQFVEENAQEFAIQEYRDRKTGVSSNEEPSQVNIEFNLKRSAECFFQGMGAAFHSELDNFENIQKEIPSENRLFRAIQIFTQSFRIKNPSQRFTFMITCLEALFSSGTGELSYQLASRIAWILEPNNFSKRVEIFDQVKTLYDFRSKIVHGDIYKAEELDGMEERLLSFVRRCFQKILANDRIYAILCIGLKKDADKYLKYLPLGPSE